MPGHDLKKLEEQLEAVNGLSAEMLKIIHFPGYTTPIEFALVLGAVSAIRAQMQTLVEASREIVGQAQIAHA